MSIKGPCVGGLVTSLWYHCEVVGFFEGGIYWTEIRSLGEHTFKENIWTQPSFLFPFSYFSTAMRWPSIFCHVVLLWCSISFDYLSENPICSHFSSSTGSDYYPPFSQAPNPLVNLQVHLATQPSLIFPPDYLSFIFLACATTGYAVDSFLIHFHDVVSSPCFICIIKDTRLILTKHAIKLP